MSVVRSRWALVLPLTFCVALAACIAVPLWVAVIGGLKEMGQLMVDPLGLPAPLNLAFYVDLLLGKLGTFWLALGNSALVAALTVGVSLTVAVLAAFALARFRFRGRNMVFQYFLLGLLFPLAVAILPLYLQIRSLGLLDTWWGVILPQTAFQTPINILLLRAFFVAIPRDLEDACAIDGYGKLGFLWNMVIPLSTPILATAAILTLVASWNNFFLPLLVFNDASKYTLPMGVMTFQGQYAAEWNKVLAYLTLAMIPAVALFVAAQRFLVAGLTAGAVKG